MTKQVVAIVSVLKPVDDTRNYEKLALSLGNTNKYAINIIGFWTKNIPVRPGITCHPVFRFGRMSIRRLAAPVVVLKILLKVKPQLIIATCIELLPVIILYKIIFGVKVIYDIQENYYRNVMYSGVYPFYIRYPLAWSIRLTEKLSAPFIDYFLLAEKVYTEQLRFTKSKSQIIENKAIIPADFSQRPKRNDDGIMFVYSGTVAAHYGIFEAIDFVVRLKQSVPPVHLHIIGHAPDRKIWQKVMDKIRGHQFISTSGGDALVPHNQILMELSKADFCLMPYHDNKSTKGRIPTKLYECLALETPVIISPNTAWNNLIKENNAGIIHDFQSDWSISPDQFRRKFYGHGLSDRYQWNIEKEHLINIVNKLLP